VKVQASPAVLHLCAGFLVSSRLVSFSVSPRAEARTTPPLCACAAVPLCREPSLFKK
jgi:hypothetical protein